MFKLFQQLPALALTAAGAEETTVLSMVEDVNRFLNNIVWGWPALILLAFVGIFMTCHTGFFQITHIGHWMKQTIGAMFRQKDVRTHTKDKSISQFQSLCTALAATVGTGNIVGVSGAILVGGPGAVFWMWLIAFFGMMTNYSENVLGIFYRRKNASGEWSGGAMYYLRDGLGAKKGCKTLGSVLAVLFSVFCFLASFGIGNMTQINSISGNMEAVFHVPTWMTGMVLASYNGTALTKANLVSTIFSMHFGFAGAAFVAIAVMLFAFSTSLGWSHYGSKACEFLFGEKAAKAYQLIFVLATFGGAVMGENLAWDIADTLNGMMMLPNLVGVLVLSPVVVRITRNYIDRKLRHKDIEPMLSNFADIQREHAAEVRAGEE